MDEITKLNPDLEAANDASDNICVEPGLDTFDTTQWGDVDDLIFNSPRPGPRSSDR